MTLTALEIRAILAQSFVVGVPGPEAGAEQLGLFGVHGLGGVILFARNVESPGQVWKLNRDLRLAAHQAGRPPLFVMVDQEGGSVARLKGDFTHQPDLADLGRTGDEPLLEAHGVAMGRELAAAGFNWDLAPVMDVHAMADGVMAKRSLGPDPDAVSRLGSAFIKGMQDQGVLACAKHFPGLGRTTLDTHREKPTVTLGLDDLKSLELKPFKAAIQNKVAGIMVCHAAFTALDPDCPASISPKVVDGFLRAEMSWQGAVLTDDLEMGAVSKDPGPVEAAVRAYLAGCDLLLICHRPELALEALDRLCLMAQQGEITPQRIIQGRDRLAALKQNLTPLAGPFEHLEAVLARNRAKA